MILNSRKGNTMSNDSRSDQENRLRLTQLEYSGKLLAGFTHELKNHLAIINESNGLLQDYLLMGKVSSPDFSDKLQDICAKMEQRVQLATGMCQALNAYAHRTDNSSTSFSVNDFLQAVLVFLERFSRLKEVEIKTSIPEKHLITVTDPALLQLMVSKIVFVVLEDIGSKEKLEVSLHEEEGEIEIGFSCNFISKEEPIELHINEVERLALEKLGASLKTAKEAQNLTVLLSVPKQQ